MEEPDDFVGFLEQMLEGDSLDGAARGVARRVIADGSMRNLSEAQHATLVLAMKDWIQEHFRDYKPGFVAFGETPPPPECKEGAHEVPWCEVYLSGAMHGGVCSWCVQVHHKDD